MVTRASDGSTSDATARPAPAPGPVAAPAPGPVAAQPGEGRARVIVRALAPNIDRGRFAAKRVVGERVEVEADVFTDGHDEISCCVLYRRAGSDGWTQARMEPLGNDRWMGAFVVTELGRYEFTVEGWVDHFKTWQHDLEKRIAANQDVSIDLLIGAGFVEQAVENATGAGADRLKEYLTELRDEEQSVATRATIALEDELRSLMYRHDPRNFATRYPKALPVTVDRERARFSNWYEMFPRSASPDPERSGTLKDVLARLPYVHGMGFDVFYLPPIHPIGTTARKGPNNVTTAGRDDVGSPWAIGGPEGGHKSVHPDLGTVDDVRALVDATAALGMDLAMDIAFQCSPDHPYVREHPDWFRARPDGTIQYAENPPKKYQDIYPFDFECDDWWGLWQELKSIFDFWIDVGVRVFRVDNPHTKPFPFWEWVIAAITREHPDVIFLAEAFTRPKIMHRLAKLGFTQSYTYFAWRNTSSELEEYFTELTQTDAIEFFRPNAWPNTPDILTEYLQLGGRPAAVTRLLLATTLAANWGLYGPVYEMGLATAREGAEEYVDSEKYEVHHWDLDAPNPTRDLITRLNRIRHSNPALQQDRNLHFHAVDNEQLLCFSKATDDGSNVILCVINVDPYRTQSGHVHLDLDDLYVPRDAPFQVHDLVGDGRYVWTGSSNYVELDPQVISGHVFQVRTHTKVERDFTTYG